MSARRRWGEPEGEDGGRAMKGVLAWLCPVGARCPKTVTTEARHTVGSLWPHPSWYCTTVPEWQRKLILEGKLKKLHLKCFKTEIMNICVSKNNIKNLSLAKALLEEGGKRACTCSGGHLEVLRMRGGASSLVLQVVQGLSTILETGFLEIEHSLWKI